MSKLFRSRRPPAHSETDGCSGYSALLDPAALEQQEQGQRSQYRASAAEYHSRWWLVTAESRPSWTAERPPARKLVKDMNGSGRPSFSLELSDNDAEKEKGMVRRQLSRLKDLYRRDK
ncbi:hypothetical protein N657DRAFT_680060 [Parathielavia appendiculata]|uniref:Uncharacterized protein n=1 Tax=Parathielavia appendiculata TaxID=2587402 RepID=A0AAN6U2Y6_9PEZI|nr:hypothetical protein N657DRAFT_680060 [Parathielavia appendiculata]